MQFNSFFLILCALLHFTPQALAKGGDISPETRKAITVDIQNNFAEKITKLTGVEYEENALSPRDLAVMLKALYIGVKEPLKLAGVNVSEQQFNKKVGQLLNAASRYGIMPAAITFGYYARAQLGVGKTTGGESNFYLSNGKLKVSTYQLKSISVGGPQLKAGYYVSLCFGACVGGDAYGSFLGLDVDVLFPTGESIYVEAGVDTTDALKAWKEGSPYSLKDLYGVKAIYIGAGIDIGFGAGLTGFYQTYELMNDIVLIDLYAMMNKPRFDERVKVAFERSKVFKSLPRLP